MAEKESIWKAVADFSKVRREAEKTDRSLEDLQRREEALARTSASTTASTNRDESSRVSSLNRLAAAATQTARVNTQAADDAVSAARTRQRAADQTISSLRDQQTEERNTAAAATRSAAQQSTSSRGVIGTLRQMAQARRDAATATQQQTAASDSSNRSTSTEAASQTRLGTVLQRVASIRIQSASARKREEQAAARLAAAEQAETKATQALSAAKDRQAAVRARLALLEAQSVAASQRLAQAQAAVAKGDGDAASAATRLERAQRSALEAESRLARARADLSTQANRVEAAESSLATATERLTRAQADAGGSGGGLSNMLRRLAGDGNNAGSAMGFLHANMSLLKFAGIAAGIAEIIPLLGQLVGGLYAIVSAAGPAVGALAAIPGGVLGLATAVGAVKAGFSGIGGALKAYQTQQQAATAATTKASKAATSNAQAIKDAKQAVSDARANAAQSAKDAALRVTEAEESAKEATKRAAEQTIAAKEQAAASVQQAAQNVVSAEKSLAEAEKNSQQAQEDLNQARKDAVQYLEDMRKSARDASFSEEDAQLGLIEAQQALAKTMNDPTSSTLDRRRAELNYREAQARLADAKEAKQKAIKDNAEAQKKGVQGTDIMVQANQKAADSAQAVVDAQKALAQAQADQAKATKDAAKTIADAEANQAKVAKDNARNIAAAKEAQQKQQVASARAIQRAEESLTKAVQKQSDTMSGASDGVNKYAQAMAALSPAGQSFVKFLLSLQPKLDQLKKTAQAGLLPGVQSGIKSLLPLFPMVNTAVGRMSKSLGDAAADVGKTLGSMESQKILGRIFNSNAKAADNLSNSAAPLTRSLLRIMDAAQPLVLWFSKLILQFSQWSDKTTKMNTANGKMAGFFDKTRSSLALLGDLLKNTAGIFYNLGKAGSDTGKSLLTELDKWTKKVKDATGSPKGQKDLKAWFKQTQPTIEATGRLITSIGRAMKTLSVNKNIAPLLDKLSGPGMDAIVKILSALGKSSISGDLVDSLISIANAIGQILDNGGGGVLSAYVKTLSIMLGLFADVTKIKGVPQILTGIALALGTIKAVKLAGSITGIRGLMSAVSTHRTTQAEQAAQAAEDATGGGTQGGFRSAFRAAQQRRQQRRSQRRQDDALGGLDDVTDSLIAGTSGALGQSRGSGSASSSQRRSLWDRVTRRNRPQRRQSSTPEVSTTEEERPTRRQRLRSGAGRAAGAAGGALQIASMAPGPIGALAGALASLMAVGEALMPVFAALGTAIGAISLPILIIVGVVAGLAIAFVVLFKKNKAFHDFVIKAWNAIKAAFVAAWNAILPILKEFGSWLKDKVGAAAQWLWSKVIKPVFTSIGSWIASTWTNHIWPALKAFGSFLKNDVGPAIKWFWNKVIKPVFSAIGSFLKATWNDVLKPVFKALWTMIKVTLGTVIPWIYNKIFKPYFGFILALVKLWWKGLKLEFTLLYKMIKFTIGTVIPWLYNKVVKPIFKAIGAAIKAVWDKVIHPVFSALNKFIRGPLTTTIKWLYNNGVKPIFNSIGSAIKGVWDRVIKPTFSAIKTGVDLVKKAFSAAESGIGKAWKKIKSAVKTPIKWAVDHAINPIIGAVNALIPGSGPFSKIRGFDTGGWTGPGSRYQPAGVVHADEFVVSKPSRRKFESRHPGALDHINRTGDLPGFAGGGRVPTTGNSQGGTLGMKWSGAEWYRPGLRGALVAELRKLQKSGWTILEMEPFDRVDPVHDAHSLHYLPSRNAGDAADISRPGMKGADGVAAMLQNMGFGVKWRSPGHYNHIHVDTSLLSEIGGKWSKVKKGGGDGGIMSWITDHLSGPKKILSGALGKLTSLFKGNQYAKIPLNMAKKAGAGIWSKATSTLKGMPSYIMGKLGLGIGSETDNLVTSAVAAAAQVYAKSLFKSHGWSKAQWPALQKLWQRESGWNPEATNRSSGAYGIPQSLPASKMDAYGNRNDYKVQVRWGEDYIAGRYGTPSRAWAHEVGVGWYAKGGRVKGTGSKDTVRAMLTPGEFVIRKGAAKVIGLRNLQALNRADSASPEQAAATSSVPATVGGLPAFADGGAVGGGPDLTAQAPGMLSWWLKFVKNAYHLPTSAWSKMSAWDHTVTEAFHKHGDTFPLYSSFSKRRSVPGGMAAIAKWMRGGGVKLTGKSVVDNDPIVKYGTRNNAFIKRLQKLLGIKADGNYGPGTRNAINKFKHEWYPTTPKKYNGNLSRYFWEMLGKVKYPKSYKGSHTLPGLTNHLGWSQQEAVATFNNASSKAYLKKHVPAAYLQNLMTELPQFKTITEPKWVKDLQSMLGVAQTGKYSDTYGPSIAKVLKYGSSDVLGKAIIDQGDANALQQEFNKYLDLFASWGLPALVSKLADDGYEQDIDLARAAAKNKTMATEYNKTLQDAQNLAQTTGEDAAKFMATIMAPGPQQGIRSLAQTLGMADYAVVQMYEDLTKAGRLKSGERTARLGREVKQFRAGTFYAATGGRVPGTGSGDTVPAMLTPGEFVIRKAAAKALGVERLQNLNHIDHYATGGVVLPPRNPYMPVIQSSGGHWMTTGPVGRYGLVNPFLDNNRVTTGPVKQGVGPVTNINTTINNPVAERSTASVNQMLRRRAALGNNAVGSNTVTVVNGSES